MCFSVGNPILFRPALSVLLSKQMKKKLLTVCIGDKQACTDEVDTDISFVQLMPS